jgi:hypothetical protein
LDYEPGTHKAHIMISPLPEDRVALMRNYSIKEKQAHYVGKKYKILFSFFYCLLVGLIKVLKDNYNEKSELLKKKDY